MPAWLPKRNRPRSPSPAPPPPQPPSDLPEHIHHDLWTTFPPPTPSSAIGTNWTLELGVSSPFALGAGLSPPFPARLRTASDTSSDRYRRRPGAGGARGNNTPLRRAASSAGTESSSSDAGGRGRRSDDELAPFTNLVPYVRQRHHTTSSVPSTPTSPFPFGGAAPEPSSSVSGSAGHARGGGMEALGGASSSEISHDSPSSYASLGSPTPASLSTHYSGRSSARPRLSDSLPLDSEVLSLQSRGMYLNHRSRSLHDRSDGRSRGCRGDEAVQRGENPTGKNRPERSFDETSWEYKVAESLFLASRASSLHKLSTSPEPAARVNKLSNSLSSLSGQAHSPALLPFPLTSAPRHKPRPPSIQSIASSSSSYHDAFPDPVIVPSLSIHKPPTTVSDAKDTVPTVLHSVLPSTRASIIYSPSGDRGARHRKSYSWASTAKPGRVRFLSGVSISSLVTMSPPLSPTHVVDLADSPFADERAASMEGRDSWSFVPLHDDGESDRIALPFPLMPLHPTRLPLLPRESVPRPSSSSVPNASPPLKTLQTLLFLGILFPPCWWFAAFLSSPPPPSKAITAKGVPLKHVKIVETKEDAFALPSGHLYGPMSAWPDHRPGARVPQFFGTTERTWLTGWEKVDGVEDQDQKYARWRLRCRFLSFVSLFEIAVLLGFGVWAGRS